MSGNQTMRWALALACAASVGCQPASDPTAFATQLTNPQDLVIDAHAVYWTSQPPPPDTGSAPPGVIQSIPISGGAPTTLIASTQSPTALAVDGSHLYWIDLDGNGQPEIMSANLDGTGAGVLASNLPDVPTAGGRMMVQGGTLFWGGPQGVHGLSTSGGFVSIAVAGTAASTGGTALVAADATGLYWIDINPGLGSDYKHSALDGTNVVRLVIGATLSRSTGLSEDGTNAYWIPSTSATTFSLFDEPIGGGTPTKVFDYTAGGAPDYLASDSVGLYFCDSSSGGNGVYQVKNGAFTLVHPGDSNFGSAPRILRLDAQNLYWFTGPTTARTAELHKQAR